MKRRMSWSIVVAAAVAVVPALAATAAEHQLSVQQSDEFGDYLADAEGRALYMFTADTQGEGDTKAESNCYDACAQAWPPLLKEAGMKETGEADTEPVIEEAPAMEGKVDASLIGTIQRTDGTTQITYDGWPLYYYVRDTGPGQTTGQDVEGFGGEWYLVAPDGSKIEKEAQ